MDGSVGDDGGSEQPTASAKVTARKPRALPLLSWLIVQCQNTPHVSVPSDAVNPVDYDHRARAMGSGTLMPEQASGMRYDSPRTSWFCTSARDGFGRSMPTARTSATEGLFVKTRRWGPVTGTPVSLILNFDDSEKEIMVDVHRAVARRSTATGRRHRNCRDGHPVHRHGFHGAGYARAKPAEAPARSGSLVTKRHRRVDARPAISRMKRLVALRMSRSRHARRG